MPMDELICWRFYLQEPRGDLRNDFHAAQITQALYTIMQSFGKNSKKIKMEDCLLKFESEQAPAKNSVNKMKLMAQGWTESLKKKKPAIISPLNKVSDSNSTNILKKEK